MSLINDTVSSGTFVHGAPAPESGSTFEIDITDASKRTLIKKTITGVVDGTGEAMNPFHVQYTVDGYADPYESMGHSICARTQVGFGSQARGTIHGMSSLMDVGNVEGVGSEVAGFFGFVNCFSTGYDNDNLSVQGFDLTVQGPVATEANRPQMLTGQSLCINSFSPTGAITDSKRGSFGYKMATVPGQGAKEDWTGLTTYPLHAGFSVSGWSGPYGTAVDGTSASATHGFDKAFHAGGTGGGVMLGSWRSKIKEAFYAEDYTLNAFHAQNPHPDFSGGSAFRSNEGCGAFYYGDGVPDAPLHIAVNGVANTRVQSATQNAAVIMQRSEGTVASPTNVTAGQIGALEAWGYKDVDWRCAGKIVCDIESTGSGFVNGLWRLSTFVAGTETTLLRASGLGILVNATGVINSSSAKLQVGNTNGGYPGIHVGNANGTSATNCITFGNSNGTVGSIQTSGSTTGYFTTSDYRLKFEDKPLTGALKRNGKLRPISYKWKDGSSDEGFLAHEFQQVFPNAVCGYKDQINENGEPVYQQMDSKAAIPHLVACVEELKAEINRLRDLISHKA